MAPPKEEKLIGKVFVSLYVELVLFQVLHCYLPIANQSKVLVPLYDTCPMPLKIIHFATSLLVNLAQYIRLES